MADMFSLAGKVAIVTGGARGLGRMIAEGLLTAGADVWITSRKEDECADAAAELGERCHALPGDAGSPDGIAAIGADFRAAGSASVHILINNAGRTWGARLESFPDKAWPGVMAVNVQAPFRMVQEFLPELTCAATPGDPARIINIGSVVGSVTSDISAYSYIASKAALHHLSRQLATDLLPRNITVNALVPGYFATSMTAHLRVEPDPPLLRKIPMRRVGEYGDIAGVAVFLASRAAAYITGVELPVDGGISGCS